MIEGLPLLLLLIGIVVIAGIILAVIAFSKGNAKRLDVAKYQVAWLKVESTLKRDDEHTYMVSVMEADKLLDKALKERGFAGQTMGDRMKSARKDWSNANSVWSAHKLRNRYAHETGTKTSYKDAAYALAAFKKALKDLGAF